MTELQEIPLRRIDGSPATLKEFAGSVLLVVNVASKCGLTPQYAGLEALYKKYQAQGLVVLGFPANDFGAQEPGSNQEIVEFCQTSFAVDFPLFEKIAVKGEAQHPLYRELISQKPQARANAGGTLGAKLAEHGLQPKQPSDVMWNFEKFLIDRHGRVADRFAPDVTPEQPELVRAIEDELAKAYERYCGHPGERLPNRLRELRIGQHYFNGALRRLRAARRASGRGRCA